MELRHTPMKLEIPYYDKTDLFNKVIELFYMLADDHSQELNEKLQALHDEREGAAPAEKSKKKPVKSSKTKPVEEETTTEQEPAAPSRTIKDIDELRAAFAAKNSAANRAELKAILTGFGVQKITQLPEDKWDDAYAELEQIS